MLNSLKKYFGPSTLVAAAFIGPGTVTVCTLAGVRSGYLLLWALLFSTLATIILQEMTGRLGLVTQQGFGEAIRSQLKNPVIRLLGIILVLSAIVIGNAAYEGGNLSGAVLGWEELFSALTVYAGGMNIKLTPLIIGGIAFILLWQGNFKYILGFMTGLVVVMSVVFVTTAIMIKPDIAEIFKGLFLPRVYEGDLITVIALVGTTVVPYNLFLHASTIQEKYSEKSDLKAMRIENAVGILIGGFISICIVITSAGAFSGMGATVSSASDMAAQLEPLLGSWAGMFMGLGLFAAGISSAITAPLAAAYAAKGIMGWKGNNRTTGFRLVWITILLIGIISSSLSLNPVQLIEFAQIANGILLPVVAVFLLYIMNRSEVLGGLKNSAIQNILGLLVVLIAILLGFRSLNAVFNLL
ncbi:Nramp family divalent metal transporter [Balneola sp. MJW-20]|uniref:Nramp family divalent metal transporter n=1 Tax=Gracilimonas aurantiaca TaxID=3234185 RepID=UPI003466E3E6